jgi:ribosome-binding protein aMBF1 (putative translation factor)
MQPIPFPDVLTARTQATVRDHLRAGRRGAAIRLIRERAHLGLDEAAALVDAIAGQPQSRPVLPAGPDGTPRQQPAQAGDVHTDLTASFATALRRARRMAGDPPYAGLADRTRYSTPTISRAFAGRILPKWEVTERILAGLGIPAELIAGEWRGRWAEARDQVRPVTCPPGLALAAAASASAASAGSGLPDPQPGEPARAPAAVRLCEDCGALVGDMVRHEAWHWRIERQHRRSVIRAVDSTGS